MRNVYLDHAAATPLRPEVLEAMIPYLKEHFGNPLSLHSYGDAPREAVEKARVQVASLIGAQEKEIFFTSNGSEANNLALKGIAFANQRQGKHIIVSVIEHHSVLHSAQTLEKLGFEVTYVPVDRYGLVNPDHVAQSLREDTVLVSIIHASNEIGTIQPIAEIARLVKQGGRRIYVHTDAVQTAGTLPVDVEQLGVDLLTLAGSAFYGPKGAGALYIRRGTRIMPLIDGGIQEKGRRAGTENVPAIVGLGVAAELAKAEMEKRIAHVTPLRDKLIQGLTAIDHVYLTGHPTKRLPGLVSVVVEYIEGEAMLLLLNMNGIAASSGSTCTSRALKASHVLTALGLDPALA
ncbi:MAG: cysteine desulfurase, partial [Chloroflexi bacterium]|nr:cysteine desulfurase [Chloroflexota bacterium]